MAIEGASSNLNLKLPAHYNPSKPKDPVTSSDIPAAKTKDPIETIRDGAKSITRKVGPMTGNGGVKGAKVKFYW